MKKQVAIDITEEKKDSGKTFSKSVYTSKEEFVKKLIEDKGFTLKHFAGEIDVPYTTLVTILKNNINKASVDNVIKIAQGLETSVEELENKYQESLGVRFNIGEKIKYYRKQKNLSVDQLGVLIDKDRATIYRYENDEIKNIPYDVLFSIAKALNISVASLLESEVAYEDSTFKNTELTIYVGNKIKEFRIKKKYTQKELGLKIGVKHNTISSYETGTNEPDQDTLFALAQTLEVPVDNFFPSYLDTSENTLDTSELRFFDQLLSKAKKLNAVDREKFIYSLQLAAEFFDKNKNH